MDTITLKNPLDMHLHLREGEILESVLPFSADRFLGGVVMPNLKQPLTNANLADNYYQEIKRLAKDFYPIMSIYLNQELNQKELEKALEKGFKVLKLYPKGSTTNSSNGVEDILDDGVLKILEIAQDLGFILSIHGESNGFSLDREYEFLKVFEKLSKNFPKLKIILEHMSDHRSIQALENFENLYATLTLHHITMDLDDLLGKGLNPHYFCKPILKTPKDKEMLLELALQAHPKVSFGSDSAPHLLSKKLCENSSAGIFSAPYLLESLVELFEKHNALDNLQSFVSDNAIKNYNLSFKNTKLVKLIKQPTIIPSEISIGNDRIIPLNCGKTLQWKLA
ncbi:MULTISPECIES: dihydroorotase [unclassified Helicobacter]|uniref:dihydroorotase n=1 Tax=unclassified Helicobacter TaxID=2593540 RepID=UPI000CF0F0EF|nr:MULTISPECIES: dihydroorotase [unclassified Helicobacter]